MAKYQNLKVVNLPAGENLKGALYHLLRFENDDGVAKVVQTSGSTASSLTAIGILAEEPTLGGASEDSGNVPVVMLSGGGICTMRAGASITAGQLVLADSDAGRLAAVDDIAAIGDDQMVVGVALESAADGEYLRVLLQPMTSAANA